MKSCEEIVHVKSVYGGWFYVSKRNLSDTSKKLLRRYNRFGEKTKGEGFDAFIHRSNLVGF